MPLWGSHVLHNQDKALEFFPNMKNVSFSVIIIRLVSSSDLLTASQWSSTVITALIKPFWMSSIFYEVSQTCLHVWPCTFVTYTYRCLSRYSICDFLDQYVLHFYRPSDLSIYPDIWTHTNVSFYCPIHFNIKYEKVSD